MCFKGFVCELDNTRVSPEDCLSCSYDRQVRGLNTCHYPPPVIQGIIESNQPRDLMGYSATELIGCHRRVVLKEQVDYWVKPSRAYWAFRGQLGHAIVAGYTNGQAQAIVEKRYYAELDGMLITGQPDVVYPDDRLLVDYKTTKSVPKPVKRYVCPECGSIIRENQWYARQGSTLSCDDCGEEYVAEEIKPQVLSPQPYDTHVQQLNVYAWLLAQNDVPVERLQVVYLDMSEPYPLPVELWPLAKTEAYIRRQLHSLMSRDHTGLPAGVWDDADVNWRCRYCEVAEACERSRAEETLARGRELLRGDGVEI